MVKITLTFALCFLLAKNVFSQETYLYDSNDLKIEKVSDNAYRHITFLNTQDWGKVACNGMIATDDGEAIIFDTPITDSVSTVLIDYVEHDLNCKVIGIVATHFHTDCLGGLKAFHDRNIPSYAFKMTLELAKPTHEVIPLNGFDKSLELKIGSKKVILDYLGGGHTRDNIIGYFPSEQVMFGGCLVKSLKSGKGNLEDADVKAWPNTIQTLKTKYKDVKVVIPGHGNPGDAALLDYTLTMFAEQ